MHSKCPTVLCRLSIYTYKERWIIWICCSYLTILNCIFGHDNKIFIFWIFPVHDECEYLAGDLEIELIVAPPFLFPAVASDRVARLAALAAPINNEWLLKRNIFPKFVNIFRRGLSVCGCIMVWVRARCKAAACVYNSKPALRPAAGVFRRVVLSSPHFSLPLSTFLVTL